MKNPRDRDRKNRKRKAHKQARKDHVFKAWQTSCMAKVMQLTPGADCPVTTQEERSKRIEHLKQEVETLFPFHLEQVKQWLAMPTEQKEIKGIFVRPVVERPYLSDKEFSNLGKLIKYAGLFGAPVKIEPDKALRPKQAVHRTVHRQM